MVGGDRVGTSLRGPARILGVALFLAGQGLDLASMLYFRRARTPVIPFKPTTAIVTDGPYRFTRNPIYLGMALSYAGAFLFLGYLWPAVTLPLTIWAVDRWVIAKEERYLESKFGTRYNDYRARVRRWI
jgi:protein-S-isoprenylcysteine O-methyltransferase Ste14